MHEYRVMGQDGWVDNVWYSHVYLAVAAYTGLEAVEKVRRRYPTLKGVHLVGKDNATESHV